jgi:CrcB protein
VPAEPLDAAPRAEAAAVRRRRRLVAAPWPRRRRAREPWLPKVDARELAAIAAGGALGALARTGLAQAFPPVAGHWPWATFAVNVAGAVALGYFATRLQERLPLSSYRRPLLGTGLCGALTTFSTLQVELLHMLDAGRLGLAAGYAAASVAAGYAAVTVTTGIVRRVRVLR